MHKRDEWPVRIVATCEHRRSNPIRYGSTRQTRASDIAIGVDATTQKDIYLNTSRKNTASNYNFMTLFLGVVRTGSVGGDKAEGGESVGVSLMLPILLSKLSVIAPDTVVGVWSLCDTGSHIYTELPLLSNKCEHYAVRCKSDAEGSFNSGFPSFNGYAYALCQFFVCHYLL